MKKSNNVPVLCSCIVMGTGQLMYKQWIKGIIYLAVFILFLYFIITTGIEDIIGFFTLGTVEGDAWLGIEGDDSIMMMLRGILAFIVIALFGLIHYSNIKDILYIRKSIEGGKEIPSFVKSIALFTDKKFYIVALAIPVVGVLIFNVLPIIFMTLIAFTNYGGDIVPPKLVDWIGFDNFKKIFVLSDLKGTFVKILGWNIIWAVASTFINYFGGLFLALLLNKECVKGKTFWRAFPILAYAVPGFITLLGFKFMFSYGGPINYLITRTGASAIGFLDIDAGWRARIIGLLVNAWISIPTSMLLATGMLSNMNKELYEAASIDGATKWVQFIKLTLPFVVFSTTPTLITSFVGNFNNFGVFYFLRGGLYLDGYFLASDTDLLINWLYNLSIDNNYYGIGAAISLIIFLITSVLSLGTYVNSSAFKKEDTYR
ncbi:MAG: sugar ABC transporter permease [Butyrivibrio sp.]|uniref:carbohydrate ABC transporter permease n=1 Tax=Butyrivibrio sp. TaxID=28121 RepID=UPI0025F1F334|nr:sugar ABC transporter permease [Butyrivibrio sp.]MCR5773412.1 sugar ABC transporter permease [Butyrivibrio sp.]